MSKRPAAGFHQKRIRMAVVTTVELDDFVAAGEPARQPKSGHGRFSSAVNHADFLNRWHPLADQLCKLYLQRVRNSKAKAAGGRIGDCLDHHRRRVAENGGSPAPYIINVLVAI